MESVTRRQFLERTSMAAAAIALVPPIQTASPGKMFVSLNGAVSRGVAWPDNARLAARLGYGGIDWSLGPAKQAGVDATRALFAELKLKPTVVNLPLQGPLNGDDASFREKLPALAEDAAFISAVGGRNLMMVLSPSSPRPRDEQRKLVVDRMKAVAEVLAKSNLRLGFEFLGPLCMRMGNCGGGGGGRRGAAPAAGPAAPAAAPSVPPLPVPAAPTPFIWTLPETVALAEDIGPNVGAVLDVWHWHHSGGTVQDILATDKARIVHVHLSDAREMPPEQVRDNMRLMPGEGIIDLTGFLRALQKIGYVDGVAPEPLGPRIPMDMPGEEAAKLGFDTTYAAMKKAGVI